MAVLLDTNILLRLLQPPPRLKKDQRSEKPAGRGSWFPGSKIQTWGTWVKAEKSRYNPFMVLFKSRSSKSLLEETFWEWFARNEESLFDFETDQETIFDRLAKELHKVNPHLTFEFGSKVDGCREFTISADGIRDAFQAVEMLYAKAPTLPQWKILKFRQRQSSTSISYGGVEIEAASVRFLIEQENKTINLNIFISDYSQTNHKKYAPIAYLLLDQALGEYDVETHIGQIKMNPLSIAPEQACSISEFPRIFDTLLGRI